MAGELAHPQGIVLACLEQHGGELLCRGLGRGWRSLKDECVYLHELTGGRDARQKIGQWVELYNRERPHAALDGKAPDIVYFAYLGL